MRKLLSLVIAGAMLTAFAGTALAQSDSDTSVTQVTVQSVITIDAPALLNFGSGVPGDVKTLTDEELLVETNNEAGYTVTIGAPTTMASTGTSTDVQSAPSFTLDGTGITAERSAEGGDTLTFDGSLEIDFVDAGVYEGSVEFTATAN